MATHRAPTATKTFRQPAEILHGMALIELVTLIAVALVVFTVAGGALLAATGLIAGQGVVLLLLAAVLTGFAIQAVSMKFQDRIVSAIERRLAATVCSPRHC